MAVKILKQIVTLGGRRPHTHRLIYFLPPSHAHTLVLISDYLPSLCFPTPASQPPPSPGEGVSSLSTRNALCTLGDSFTCIISPLILAATLG